MTHPYFIYSNLYNTAPDRSGETFEAKRSRLWPASRTNRYRVQVGSQRGFRRFTRGGSGRFDASGLTPAYEYEPIGGQGPDVSGDFGQSIPGWFHRGAASFGRIGYQSRAGAFVGVMLICSSEVSMCSGNWPEIWYRRKHGNFLSTNVVNPLRGIPQFSESSAFLNNQFDFSGVSVASVSTV